MIGIFGGTFDPIHYGHLRTALDVQQALSLTQVRFIPCGEPAHRDKPVASALHRLSMVRAAVASHESFIADDREIKRRGPSYMADTLASLKTEFSGESLCLLLGSDAFNGLESWHRWQAIFKYANIAVMQRPNELHSETSIALLNENFQSEIKHRVVFADKIKQYEQGKLCFIPVTQLDISASKIRNDWQQAKDIQFLLPDSVLRLIQQQQIY